MTPSPSPPPDAPPPNRPDAFEALLLVGGLALFLAMVAAIQIPADVVYLNPLVLAAAAALMLWPLREHRTARTILITGVLLLGLWLLDVLSQVLLPFFLAFLLAFLFNPLVARLRTRFNIPRWISALVVTGLAVGLTALLLLQVVPALLGQFGSLALRILDTAGDFRAWLATAPFLDRFEAAGLIDKEVLVREVTGALQQRVRNLSETLPQLVQSVLNHLGSLFGLITLAAVTPVVLYYTLKDYPTLTERLEEVLPTFGGRRDYLVEMSQVVGSYLRGLLTISAIAAFNVSIALLLLDAPFALLIGILAGLLNLIPNLGAIITAIFGVLIGFIFGDSGVWTALTILLVLLGQGLLEQSILVPKILSNHVGLHPVLILLSLFVFGSFLGLAGLLIAVPVTAILMGVYKAYRKELTLELSADARLKRDLARHLFGKRRTEPAPEEAPAREEAG